MGGGRGEMTDVDLLLADNCFFPAGEWAWTRPHSGGMKEGHRKGSNGL